MDGLIIIWKVYIFEGNYFHWKGITLTGFNQIGNGIWNTMVIKNSSHNLFEKMVYSYGMIGFDINANSDDNLLLNCDFHHNSDPGSDDSNGNADGANAHTDHGTTNTFRGCRFWSNSDDGIDLFNGNGLIIVDQSWSFMNGYQSDGYTKGGDGWGFKGGITSSDYGTEHLRTFTNCLAFHNREGGFGQNEAQCIFWLYNNVAYHNNDGGSNPQYFLGFWFDSYGGTPYANIAKNNISYQNQNTSGVNALWSTTTTEDHNSWDRGVTVTDADFVSTNSVGVDGPRQADGSLPNLSFLHPAAGSSLIDAGVGVGIPFNGNSPDIGAFEYQSGSIVAVPSFQSSAVENTTPTLLELTYNLTLANIVPATTSFLVMVNSVARTVSSIAITGSKVQLSLASAVKFGDIITVSYTKPTSNPLQTAAGALASTISAQVTINNLINPSKDAPISITMIISPKHIHNIINISFTYSVTPTTAQTPEILRISDLSGNLLIEKYLVTRVANIKIPLKLNSGIYNVTLTAAGINMDSQRIVVY